MNKYIPADKLIAEINDRLHCNGTFDEVGDSAWHYDQGMIDAYKHIKEFITSLQQEQLIDKNILTWRDVNEIERIINKVHYEFPHGIGEEAFGKLVLERFIDGKDDLQEQLEVDLEKEIRDWCKENVTGVNPIYTADSLIYGLLPKTARHFYELGKKARKEE